MSGELKRPVTKAATPQCQFFVQRKKRLCRMTVKPGRQYCGEHEPQPQTEAGQSDKRIPCPNDPKHTIYTSKLLKHLAICNARCTPQPPYIIHNVNAPEDENTCPRRTLSAVPKDELNNVVDKINHLYAKHVEGHITEEPVEPIHPVVLAEFGEAGRAESSLRHLRQVSALLRLAERAGLPRPRTCYVELGAGRGQLSYYACHAWCGAGAGRVLAVDRAPARHKRDNKLRAGTASRASEPETADSSGVQNEPLKDAAYDTLTLRGNRVPNDGTNDDNIRISKMLVGNTNGSSNIDSDKRSHSNVAPDEEDADVDSLGRTSHDTGGARAGEEEPGAGGTGDACEGEEVAVRLRADLAHLALEAVPAVVGAQAVVGLAKHLCGVAMDYALRCVVRAGRKTRGAVLATCCHHRLEQAAYVARAQLQELGITDEDFNIMLGIVSWATCGDGRSRGARGAGAGEGEGEGEGAREEAGRRAKALLDWGRVLWLRARGFDARLAHYVPRAVSCENRALVAVRRDPADRL